MESTDYMEVLSQTLMVYADYRYEQKTEGKSNPKKDIKYSASFTGKLSVGYSQCLTRIIKKRKYKVKIVVYDDNLDGRFTGEDQIMIKVNKEDPVFLPLDNAVLLDWKSKTKYIFHLNGSQSDESIQDYRLDIKPAENE